MKKSVIQIILMFLASITLWSCASETNAYARLVSEWQGREIVLAILSFTGDTIYGEFERTIHVYLEDFEYPTVINVSGNIIQ